MRVVGNSPIRSENFNGVSQKLKDELIKKPENGQINLQLLNGVYDPALKRTVFGASRSIRLRDRILDPYAIETKDDKGKIEYKSAYVEIGVPESFKEGRVDRCKKHWVESVANGIPGGGQFSLSSSSVDEFEKYEFFCLSNGNVNNPYRDISKPAEYEIVDADKAKREQKDKDFKDLQARLKLFAKHNPDEAQKLQELIPAKKEPALK